MALARRHRVLTALLVGSVVVAVGGVVAAHYVRSPEQALADIGPPVAAPLLEPVEERVLAETLILRGKVTPEGSITVNVNALTGDGTDAVVVTAVPVAAEQQVAPGDVILEVSGRPVILLQGTAPLYRDLEPGDHGDDVAQIQQSLAALGYDLTSDGEYGKATVAAVERLYADRGYEAPTVGDPVAVKEANRAVLTAQYALDDAAAGVADARSALAAATTDDASDLAAAQRSVDQAVRAQASAEMDLDLVREQLADLEASTGAALPRSEVLLVPGADMRVDHVGVQVGLVAGTDAGDGPGSQSLDGTLSISWGQLTATALVSAHQRALLGADMVVGVADELGAWSGDGRIASVGEETKGIDTQTGYPVIVAADDGFPADLADTTVRITATSAATDGPVLVVPFAALATSSSGQAVVDRSRDGARASVEVTVGAQGDGFVQVTPLTAGDLQVGDFVVVGVTATTSPTTTTAEPSDSPTPTVPAFP